MLVQFLTDLNTVVGLCAALFAFDFLLNQNEKLGIANHIGQLVKSATKWREEFRDSTRAVGTIIQLIVPNSKKGLYRVMSASAIFIAVSIVASYLVLPLWGVSIYMFLGDLRLAFGLLVSATVIATSVIASWWMSLYLLPVLKEARGGFAFVVFLIAATCIALLSYVVPRAPAYLLLRALPIADTVIVPIQASFSDLADGTQTPISLNVRRLITPEEKLFMQGLRYVKETPIAKSGSKPGTYSYAVHETITTVKDEDLFVELGYRLSYAQVCGHQVGQVLLRALEVTNQSVDAVGGGLLNCALLRASSLVRRVDIVFREPLNYSSISLGFGGGIGPIAIRRSDSEGVAFIGDIYISRVLRGDPNVKTELDDLRKLFDKRGFDSTLATIAGAENVFVLSKTVIGFVPLLAVVVLLSLAALKVVVKLTSLTTFAWLLLRLERAPCTVMAYLILIASIPFLLVKAILI
jgi:hypothetical protein